MPAIDTPIDISQLPPIKYSDIQREIHFDDVVDLETVARSLNIDLSSKMSWGKYSISSSASYTRHLTNTDYTENFTYLDKSFVQATLDIHSLLPGIKSFTPSAQELCKNDQTCQAGINDFNDRYGDMLIESLPLGALLLINFQIHFNSFTDKQQFDDAASVKGLKDIFSASDSIQYIVQQSGARGSIEVSAYQLGGDPSQLAQIFAKKTADSYYITSCRLDDLKDCGIAISHTIDYAKDGFSQQIKVVGGKPQGILTTVGDPAKEPYAAIFNIVDPPDPSKDVINARKQLSKIYDQTLSEKIFVDHYLTSLVANELRDNTRYILKTSQKSLDLNYDALVSDTSMICYKPKWWRTKCVNTVASLQDNMEPVNESTIQYLMQNAFHEKDLSTQYHYQSYLVPIGDGYYVSYRLPSYLKTSTWLTIKLLNDEQQMVAEAVDTNGHHCQANYPKIGDHYHGDTIYDDGNHITYDEFKLPTNPI
jgi:hypothetical protein